MTLRKRKTLLALAVAASAVIVAAAGLKTPAARAQVTQVHLELAPVGGKTLQGIPGNCSTWHEIFPAYCTPHHQTGYEDNGDGEVSVCDYILLDGARWHVVWVGPTYWLDCGPGGQSALEPTAPQTGGNPTCETWQEIYPNFGTPRHVDDWQDNGDGVLSACDMVFFQGLPCHIFDIRLNITIEPAGSTGTDEGSWGRLKSGFRRLL